MADFALFSKSGHSKRKYTGGDVRTLTRPVRAGNFNQINEC